MSKQALAGFVVIAYIIGYQYVLSRYILSCGHRYCFVLIRAALAAAAGAYFLSLTQKVAKKSRPQENQRGFLATHLPKSLKLGLVPRPQTQGFVGYPHTKPSHFLECPAESVPSYTCKRALIMFLVADLLLGAQ